MDKQVVQYYRALDDDTLRKFWKSGGIIQGVEYPLADTFLHTHTDLGSPKDSILTVDEYVKIASDMGASSISVTDHGCMYGVIPLYKACDAHNAGVQNEEERIKCIIGVEFYVCESFDSQIKKKKTRLHLIAYAKDNIGYHVLCRLTTEANKHIISAGDNDYPCISRADLERYLGPGSEGHGHVILTSACIGGVIAGMMFESDNEAKNCARLEHAIKSLQELSERYQYVFNKIQDMDEAKKAAQLLSKKTYKKRISALEKHPDPEEQAKLDAEIKESEEAKKQVSKYTIMIKQNKDVLSTVNTEIDKLCKNVEGETRIDKAVKQLGLLQQEFEKSKQNIITEDQVEERFTEAMQYYEALAGKGNWFIEMQFHGISQEKKYIHVLATLACKLDMPLVAANDAHMATRDMTEARKIVNALRFNATWEAPSEDEYELYLKTDAQLFQWLCKEIPEDLAFEAMKNRKLITDACNVTLVKEKHYPKYIA